MSHFKLEKERDTVERISAKEVTMEEFIEKYEKPGKVVIIQHMMDQWPAMNNWQRGELVKRFGQTKFRTDEVKKVLLFNFNFKKTIFNNYYQ